MSRSIRIFPRGLNSEHPQGHYMETKGRASSETNTQHPEMISGRGMPSVTDERQTEMAIIE